MLTLIPSKWAQPELYTKAGPTISGVCEKKIVAAKLPAVIMQLNQECLQNHLENARTLIYPGTNKLGIITINTSHVIC